MWHLDVLEISSSLREFQRLTLTAPRLLQLRQRAHAAEFRAFLFSQEHLPQLTAGAGPGLAFRIVPKHAARGLKGYVRPMPELLCLRADYRDPGQARRGVGALVSGVTPPFKSTPVFVAVPAKVFAALCARTPAATAGLHEDSEGDAAANIRRLLEEMRDVEVPAGLRAAFCGAAPAVELVRRLIVRAAHSEHPVLIEGETGTGKEVVARQIHDVSGRAVERFMPVNCAGIPTELLESELFGHVKGAFTGALRDKDGLWTLAQNGTLFLDEIGELTPTHQAKVLRAMEDGQYRPVGADREIRSNARIIAATNRDLGRMVEQKQFREDLYYRLFVFRIRTPPLRDHPDDLPELANHLWRKISGNGAAPPLSREDERLLRRHSWPGNARELRAFLANVHALSGQAVFNLKTARVVYHDRGYPGAAAPDP